MFADLQIDLQPGVGFGIFQIGTSLWTLLDTLRRNSQIYPQIEIKYDSVAAITTPIIIHVRPHLDLLFSGKEQRLHTLCIRRLRDTQPPVIVRYKDVVLSSPDEVLRRVGVSKAFGPTYPGDELRYPGIRFTFDDDTMGDDMHSLPHGDRNQEVKRIIISQTSPEGYIDDALGEVSECPAMDGELARAVVKIHDGVTLYFHPAATSSPIHVRIGETTAQDLTLDLGPPLRVHYKDDHRMTIHAATKPGISPGAVPLQPGYFYNYLQHGIDFLISGTTHVVTKIILHTNVVGSPLFQRYKRCCWEIEGPPEDDEDDSPPRKRFFDRFETVSHFICPGRKEQAPPSMLLNRTDEEEDLLLPNATTHLHGYDGVILEVTDHSHIVSVMLF